MFGFDNNLEFNKTPTPQQKKQGFTKEILQQLAFYKLKETIISLFVKQIATEIYKTNGHGSNFVRYDLNDLVRRLDEAGLPTNFKEERL